MDAVHRIIRLLLWPREEWERIAREDSSVDELLRRFILPLSLLAPIASVVGMKVFDAEWDPKLGYLVADKDIFAAAAATLFATIVSVFALAGIFVLIAPLYGSTRDYATALKVATYGAVPVMLAGATLVMPMMAIVGVGALVYSLFLYWLAAKQVLHVGRRHQAEFVGISLMLLIMVSTLAGAAASALGFF